MKYCLTFACILIGIYCCNILHWPFRSDESVEESGWAIDYSFNEGGKCTDLFNCDLGGGGVQVQTSRLVRVSGAHCDPKVEHLLFTFWPAANIWHKVQTLKLGTR